MNSKVIRQQVRKPCRICGEGIAIAAQKCIHCDSYQDWRRQLPFSSTILSLLVALVAVFGQTFPIVYSKLHVREAEISYAIQTTGYRNFAILAVNDGDRTGVISSGFFKINEITKVELELMDESGIVLLAPKSTMLLHFSAMGELGTKPISSDRCYIAIPVTDQDGLKSFDDKQISCDFVSGWFGPDG